MNEKHVSLWYLARDEVSGEHWLFQKEPRLYHGTWIRGFRKYPVPNNLVFPHLKLGTLHTKRIRITVEEIESDPTHAQPPPDNMAGMSMAELLDAYREEIGYYVGKLQRCESGHHSTIKIEAIRAEIDARIAHMEEQLRRVDEACQKLSDLKGKPHDLTTE